MEFPTLHTDRLLLTELTNKHAEELYKLLSNPEVVKYYGMNPFSKLEDAEKLIANLANNFRENRGIRWAITLKDSGEFIGTAGLNGTSFLHKRAEAGYDLQPEFWRKGYASEALEAILRYSFVTLGFARIGAVIYPENGASWKMAEKLGFQKEGLLRSYMQQNGTEQDTYIYSLLKQEWQASRAQN